MGQAPGEAFVPDNSSSLERSGLQHFQQAVRSSNLIEFVALVKQAKKDYSFAQRNYHSRKLVGFEKRSAAWVYYLEFCLAKKPSIQKRNLEKAWSLAKQAMAAFEKAGDNLEYARTYDQLSSTVGLSWDFHWSPEVRGRELKEGVDYGRKSVKALAPHQDDTLLARICARTALFLDTIGNEGSEIHQIEEMDWEGLQLWKRAEELDKDAALFQVCFPPGGFFRLVEQSESRRIHNEALEIAKRHGDKFAIGWILAQQAGWTFFDGMQAYTTAETIRYLEKSLALAEEARKNQEIVNFISPNCGLMWSVSPYTEYFIALSWFQNDPANRKLFLKKAEHESASLLRSARSSGWPRAPPYSDHVTSKIYAELSELEPRRREKLALLRKALKYRLRASRATHQIQPNDLHTNSSMLNRLGEIRSEMADLVQVRGAKIRMLKIAVEEKRLSIESAMKYTTIVSRGKPHLLHRVVGASIIIYGDLLVNLYRIGGDPEVLEIAAEAYADAVKFLKSTRSSRGLGEAYWKMGELYDQLGSNLAAAESFSEAAKTYQIVAEKNPKLGQLFVEYARYLEAWSNIEQALASHRLQRYDESEKFYQRAADLHQSSNRWAFLTPYYQGLANRERAELLSRAGNYPEAVTAFSETTKAFQESYNSLRNSASRLEEREEKAMVERMISTPHQDYCLARVMIEEAKIADQKGDYATCADKFRQASHLLAATARTSQVIRERKELEFMCSISRAWEQMARTNLADQDEGFTKAALLFQKSFDISPDESSRALSIGYKHFCKALASNSKFNETLELTQYEAAVKNFTTAATQFSAAGLEIQSAHAQASKFLLDATMQMAIVSKGTGTADLASVQEKIKTVLAASADCFGRAHQKGRQERTLQLIDSLDHEGSLVASEISKTGSDISSLVSFPSFGRGPEVPIGYARFGRADIEARYAQSEPDKVIDENELLVGIEVSNIGSKPVRLIKIIGLIPDKTELVKSGANDRVEGKTILLEPKLMHPLTVEKMVVRLKRRIDVPVVVAPKIVFLDDKGKSSEYSLPERILADSPIMKFLTQEFLSDSRSKKLAPDHCGWRTLSNITSSLRIPRSQVYGEPRWGHRYGRQLEELVRLGIVEVRRFPGERGRGGEIMKVRLAYNSDIVEDYIELLPKRFDKR